MRFFSHLLSAPPPWAIFQDSEAELWRSAPWWRWIFTELQQPGGVDHTSGSCWNQGSKYLNTGMCHADTEDIESSSTL